MSIGLATDGYYGSGGRSDGDVQPPVVVAVSPSTNTDPGDPGGFSADWFAARSTPIVISITDVDPGVSFAAVSIELVGLPAQLAYRMGGFSGDYVINSFETALPPGLELTILPVGGWSSQSDITEPSYLVAHVDAVDYNGNFSHVDLVWRLPPESPAPPIAMTVQPGAMNHVGGAINRLVTQFRGDEVIEFDDPVGVFAAKTISFGGVSLVLTARVVGLPGNSISLTNDDASGVEPPIASDIGQTVFLSSSNTSTFGGVRDAVNARSALVTARVVGDPTTPFVSVTGLFSGNLSGGSNG